MSAERVAAEEAKRAALEVLLHNARSGPLPRTAGWGYPEPYTRDLMIASLGILTAGNDELVAALRRTLQTLAQNQSPLGHIPGLVDNPEDRGSSDTTPLFLIGLALFRQHTGESDFLDGAAHKALTWLCYQSPDDRGLVAQQPTSDWRDEQWVLGYGLFVNTLVYSALRLFGQDDQARLVRRHLNLPVIQHERKPPHVHEGLAVPGEPYYALWSYKVHSSTRFDLLGNCLATLTGVASRSKAQRMIAWIERECAALRRRGDLVGDLPPGFWPYIQPGDPDWHPRYERYNLPGEYHNGGVWPFIEGFYVAALVAAGRPKLARQKFAALTELVRPARQAQIAFGFSEWFRAQDGTPRGEDWQTWSAAMYLYAAFCVEQNCTPFFDSIRDS
ncbi:MAG TPA: glycoside hydrolase 100 family protein [Aggregatilineaceae bacterium]|jgi:hypothetical protein|nr:glycoside hydrolase 100 family protein [Aggregatilineaceae bacterium]